MALFQTRRVSLASNSNYSYKTFEIVDIKLYIHKGNYKISVHFNESNKMKSMHNTIIENYYSKQDITNTE